MAPRHVQDRRVAQHGIGAPKRAPRFGDDAARLVHLDVVGARMPGVEVDLVHLRAQAAVEQLLQMGGLEVRGADRTHEAGFLQLHQALEGLHVAALVRIGPMHQEEVDVVQAEARQTGLAGLARALDAVPLAVELSGDEDFAARDAGATDAFADAALVLVVLRGVDQAIAHVERERDRLGGLGIVHRPGTEAEPRHLDTVGQGEQGSRRDLHGNLEKGGWGLQDSTFRSLV